VDDATWAQFEGSAHLEVQGTRADFRIDRQRSEVITTFSAQVKPTGAQPAQPMLGLYPHHYFGNEALTQASSEGFTSIRGAIRLMQAASFETRHRYNGFVPYWPGLESGEAKAELRSLIKKDAGRAGRMMLEIGNGPYWQGKGLQRIALLMGTAAREGMEDTRQELLQKLKDRAESWMSGQSSRTYFHYDKQLGTVVSYPEEYDAVKDMNDHHFHYGYWIRAAAEMGLQDPAWIKTSAWGGMIDELVKDIATAQRGRSDYPYLRNFDPYEGHAWASGVGTSDDGNNQESSSEAINAWSGLMLWGALHGRQDLVDLGTYMYTTEIQAINHYWFDIHGQTLPPEFKSDQVSMVFGGKSLHNTWWIDEPRQIHGINLLPFTPASTYLGTSPAFVSRAMTALDEETKVFNGRGKRAKPEDIWQDLFAQHVALVDPEAGFKRWDRWGSYELGDTRSHTYHWLESLRAMGPVDLSVRADTTFYAVFKKGDTRTYMAYNAGTAPISVKFSDGVVMSCAAGLCKLTKK
jgi:endoglucanase Acf2